MHYNMQSWRFRPNIRVDKKYDLSEFEVVPDRWCEYFVFTPNLLRAV